MVRVSEKSAGEARVSEVKPVSQAKDSLLSWGESYLCLLYPGESDHVGWRYDLVIAFVGRLNMVYRGAYGCHVDKG